MKNGSVPPVIIHHNGEEPPNSELETAIEAPEPGDPQSVLVRHVPPLLTKKCQVPSLSLKGPEGLR